jgi:hypothetical protein
MEAKSLLFSGQCPDELRRSLDPASKLRVVLQAIGLDHDPPSHRSTSDVERSDVWLFQGGVGLKVSEPDDEQRLPDADEYVAVEQETDSAEYPLLFMPR